MVLKTNISMYESDAFDGFDFISENLRDDYSVVEISVNKNHNNVAIDPFPFVKQREEEVKTPPKKEQKKHFGLIRALSASIIALAATTAMVGEANAQITQIPINSINTISTLSIPLIENKEGLGILPPDMFQILTEILHGVRSVGVLAAALLLVVAGGYKMAGQSEKSKKWITEIIKGLGIVILAPILINTLVALTSVLLGGIDGLNIFF